MGLLNWLGLATTGQPLQVGDAAPDTESVDAHGKTVRLADFYDDGFTLVYFYPKAGTPGCTRQACSLRDAFSELKARGVRIVGVSADTAEAQRRFQEKQRLPFVLLADDNGQVARAFGVPTFLGLTHRQTFLIKNGKIAWRDLSASTRDQAADALQAVERLG